MHAPLPSNFYAELSDDRLRTIATALLDMRFLTKQVLSSPYDDNYTRESATFGRSRNKLIEMAMSGEYPWMQLTNAGMDVTFDIGSVPCRFFRDDPNHPEKSGFFRRNSADMLFDSDEDAPVMWRFVIEKAMTEEDEDLVYFVGYNVFQEKVSQWVFRPSMPLMHSVDRDVPAATIIPPANVGLREEESDQATDGLRTGNER